MADFTPLDPHFADRVRENFNRQTMMHTIGAVMTRVEPGLVAIELPFRADLCQQNGFLHGGVVTMIADSACGYAASTLVPADQDVLAVEFKVNLLSPAVGDKLIAVGRVIRAGRTLTVCAAEVTALSKDVNKVVAIMQGTLIQR
ncbi:MAG: PaaI family thioesterase [Chloroflexi bacterium]|nr:PaaI family thioesterase [Chloroflexota bacterium]NOG65902.1 PaaI family thioesterase [Chloroflexota bacterium]